MLMTTTDMPSRPPAPEPGLSQGKQPSILQDAPIGADLHGAPIGADLHGAPIGANLHGAPIGANLHGAPIGATQQDQDYRLLEQGYRQSPEYAAMVQRYPLLRSLIKACRGSRLVGHPPSSGHAQPPVVGLQWDRSHGES